MDKWYCEEFKFNMDFGQIVYFITDPQSLCSIWFVMKGWNMWMAQVIKLNPESCGYNFENANLNFVLFIDIFRFSFNNGLASNITWTNVDQVVPYDSTRPQ